MSTDEEDRSNQNGRRFLISQKPWRSSDVKQFLRTLDQIGVILKVELRGQPARIRVDDPQRESESQPTRGLPANLYSDEWEEGLQDWQRVMYMIRTEEQCDLTMPDWVAQ